MNRRTIIAALAGLLLPAANLRAQSPQPYRVSLIGGAFEQGQWLAGVAVDLDAGWKTYWRMPGEAGIPPQFDWSASVGVAGVETLYPVPARLHDLSGETVGYENRVVFPVIARQGADRKGALNLKLFFAVCKNICIPAKAEGELPLPGREQHEVLEWMKRVPVPGTAVRSVAAAMEAGKPVLLAKLAEPAHDIFVETASPAYFRKPQFSADGLEARLIADNVKSADELKGLALKLTVVTGISGIEQTVTVG